MVCLLCFAVCLLASVVGAVSGIGGGVIIKPVLEFFSIETVEGISFLSGCTVLSMACVSLLTGRRAEGGTAGCAEVFFLAGGAAAGGVTGKVLFARIVLLAGGRGLGAAQSATLCAIVAGLLVYTRIQDREMRLHVQSGAGCALLGAALGLLSSFLGIGGGPLNLAALGFFLSLDNREAARASLLVIFFSQGANLAFTAVCGQVPAVAPRLLGCAVCGGVGGGVLGRSLAARLGNDGIGALYRAVLVFVLVVSAGNLWGYLAG